MFKGSKNIFKAMPLLFTMIIGGALFVAAIKTDVIAMPGGMYDFVDEEPEDSEEASDDEMSPNEEASDDQAGDDSVNDSVEIIETAEDIIEQRSIDDYHHGLYVMSLEEVVREKDAKKGYTIGEVDEDYFDDALFIGDSRTDGLRLFSPVGKAKYFCKTGLNIIKLMSSDTVVDGKTLKQYLKTYTFGKIYIELGVNEGDYNTEKWLKIYEDAINEIRKLQPDAIICIQAIMYVTEPYGIKWKYCKKENLDAKNEGLKELCDNEYIFYIDVNEAVVDESGHLNPEYTGDGMHLKAKYYYLWRDYIMQNAIIK